MAEEKQTTPTVGNYKVLRKQTYSLEKEPDHIKTIDLLREFILNLIPYIPDNNIKTQAYEFLEEILERHIEPAPTNPRASLSETQHISHHPV